MQQFDYFGTHIDSGAVLDALEACGVFSFVPDLSYDGPEPLLTRTIDARLRELLFKRRRVFLWSESFASALPTLQRRETGEMAGTYYMRSSMNDPVISLTLPACYDEAGMTNLNVGMLSAPRVSVPAQGGVPQPLPELQAGFELARSAMKRALRRHKLQRWIWIGPDALQLLQAKRATIVARGV